MIYVFDVITLILRSQNLVLGTIISINSTLSTMMNKYYREKMMFSNRSGRK